MNRNIVAGQPIDSEKLDFARTLRRTMTAAETRLWSSLRARKLGGMKFRRQQIIDGYIADFYCARAGLVIELDGPIHESRVEYDELRDRVMTARGLIVMRIPNARIECELEKVLGEIAMFAGHPLRAGQTSPPGPLSASERGSRTCGTRTSSAEAESPPLRVGEGAGG